MESVVKKFDPTIWRRLRTLARPFFFGDLKGWAWGLLALLLLLSFSIKGIDLWINNIQGYFLASFWAKNSQEFVTQLSWYLLAFIIATPVAVSYRYTEERLALLWRKWLSRLVIARYFSHRSYYRLAWHEGIDNPDQRIEEDVRSFVTQTLSLFLIFLQSLIGLFAFVFVLSSISWRLTVAAFLYAFLGSVCTYYLGRSLIGLNFAQLKKEADYRYKLIKVRDSAEAIAMYRGEGRESMRTRQRLKEVVRNMLRIINRNRLLNLFTYFYNYLVIILPTVIIAPLYFRGEIIDRDIGRGIGAFGVVTSSLSMIVTNFGSLSSYAAVVRRLGAFWESLDNLARPETEPGITVIEGPHLEFDNVTIVTPTRDQELIKNLCFCQIDGGLFITGASGSGKSSVLRIIAGLWQAGAGKVVRPPLANSMFLPQRPYMVLGSLRAQLLYGHDRVGVSDDELHAVLKQVGLTETFNRLGSFEADVDWGQVLSTGEQQKLAFARVLLAQPTYLFLDEATTALDEASEEELYSLIKPFCRLYVTVGYRNNLRALHDSVLTLNRDGSWKVVGEERHRV